MLQESMSNVRRYTVKMITTKKVFTTVAVIIEMFKLYVVLRCQVVRNYNLYDWAQSQRKFGNRFVYITQSNDPTPKLGMI